jgi:hypothetical protein
MFRSLPHEPQIEHWIFLVLTDSVVDVLGRRFSPIIADFFDYPRESAFISVLFNPSKGYDHGKR